MPSGKIARWLGASTDLLRNEMAFLMSYGPSGVIAHVSVVAEVADPDHEGADPAGFPTLLLRFWDE